LRLNQQRERRLVAPCFCICPTAIRFKTARLLQHPAHAKYFYWFSRCKFLTATRSVIVTESKAPSLYGSVDDLLRAFVKDAELGEDVCAKLSKQFSNRGLDLDKLADVTEQELRDAVGSSLRKPDFSCLWSGFIEPLLPPGKTATLDQMRTLCSLIGEPTQDKSLKQLWRVIQSREAQGKLQVQQLQVGVRCANQLIDRACCKSSDPPDES
jgi:hypothetical protein